MYASVPSLLNILQSMKEGNLLEQEPSQSSELSSSEEEEPVESSDEISAAKASEGSEFEATLSLSIPSPNVAPIKAVPPARQNSIVMTCMFIPTFTLTHSAPGSSLSNISCDETLLALPSLGAEMFLPYETPTKESHTPSVCFPLFPFP